MARIIDLKQYKRDKGIVDKICNLVACPYYKRVNSQFCEYCQERNFKRK